MIPSHERPGLSWSGTVDYGPGPLHAPRSVPELQSLVARRPRIRALGTRHSFSEVAASDADLVTLAHLPENIDIDTRARTARVSAGLRYGVVAEAAHRAGLAPRSMGSLPHISVAGASATGTHGSGNRNPVLAAAVREIELVTADGDLLTLHRERDADVFGGSVLALGALGIITHLTLDLLPAYEVSQSVHLGLAPSALSPAGLEDVLAAGHSVSLFHHWDGTIAQAWVKRTDQPALPETWHGGQCAAGPVHPLPGLDPAPCTDQSGLPGPAHERLPHFRAAFTPSSGEEIQSEYFVAREHLSAAVAAVMELADRIRPILHASELRTVAADDLWLSPAHGRDSGCVHFTWRRRPREVAQLLPAIERALAPFAPRPHWGKVFTLPAREVAALYPRMTDVQALRDRLDPRRVFTSAFVDGLLGS